MKLPVAVSILLVIGPVLGLSTTEVPDRTALVERGRSIDALCRRLIDEGLTAVANGNTAGAVQSFDELIRLRAASPYLTGELDGEHPADAFVRRLEARLLADAIGLKAYAEWRAGMGPAAERTLSGSADAPRAFSERVAEHAAELFEAERWDEAARAYRVAAEYRVRARSGEHDEESARQQYNAAMAEVLAGRPEAARDLLRAVARDVPDFRSDEIAQRIRVLDEMLRR